MVGIKGPLNGLVRGIEGSFKVVPKMVNSQDKRVIGRKVTGGKAARTLDDVVARVEYERHERV